MPTFHLSAAMVLLLSMGVADRLPASGPEESAASSQRTDPAATPDPDRPVNHSVPVSPGGLPLRVHVFEDFETEIEKRWWLRGTPIEKDLPASLSAEVPNTRALRSAVTKDFDRKMGDQQKSWKAVIFNPVPGPPMAGNTRLFFRYRLRGTDRLKVQIYSLSRNYHRHLWLTDLPQDRWESACVDMTKARRPDGSGGPLAEDERIDDIQFYVGPDSQVEIDDIILYEAAAEEEHRPFPRRIIFTGWFDTGQQGKEWPGSFRIVPHEKPLTWDAAEAVKNPATGTPWIRIHLRGRRTFGAKTRLRFRYQATGSETIRISLADGERQQVIGQTTLKVAGPGWQEGSVDLDSGRGDDDEASSAKDTSSAGLQQADELRFEIDGGGTLRIDDVLLYEPGEHPEK